MTSWESSASWYDKTVGDPGHFYHQTVILPRLLKMLHLTPGSKLLDLGCGQGVLARALPKNIDYTGVDASSSLIREAQKRSPHTFVAADATEPLAQLPKDFSHAAIVLALQNIEKPGAVLKNAARHLKPQGRLAIVLNHPCFRIPRQSSWGVDAAKKLQYRRIDRYLSPLKIPIQIHPGQKESPTTWSFHHSLSDYSRYFFEAGFMMEMIEEWVSDKKSTGANARMENLCRAEFPLFLAFSLRKTP